MGKEKTRKKEYPDPIAVQLISHLSEGAYTTFAKAVKELVINSFDSDSRTVKLEFNKDYSQLEITDDGEGITSTKFRKQFLRIAGSQRRLERRKRKYNRPIINDTSEDKTMCDGMASSDCRIPPMISNCGIKNRPRRVYTPPIPKSPKIWFESYSAYE